jgi:hypothetical protein
MDMQRRRLERAELQLARESQLAEYCNAPRQIALRKREAAEMATHTRAWRRWLMNELHRRTLAEWFTPVTGQDQKRIRHGLHEAGHACACVAYGNKIVSASLIGDAAVNGRVMARRSSSLEPAEQLVTILCGPLAEMLAGGRFRIGRTVGCDGWRVEDLLIERDLAFDIEDGLESSAMYRSAMTAAGELMKEYQYKVLLLASVLLNVQILSGRDVAMVLAEA